MCIELPVLLLLKASQYFAEWALENVDILSRRYVLFGYETILLCLSLFNNATIQIVQYTVLMQTALSCESICISVFMTIFMIFPVEYHEVVCNV